MIDNRRVILSGFALALLLLGALGCQPDASEPLASDDTTEALVAGEPAEVAPPALETYADTLAMRIFEASGGPAAWHSVPYLRFNFVVARGGERQRSVQHFWDRRTGNYRVEQRGPGGAPYVALFNVNTQEGRAYWQGDTLDAVTNSQQMEEAYRRFINDTYWLLAPFKLFDPGVNRAYAPDSSDEATEALHLSFGDVGLTPGDQYWLFVDRETGRLVRWTYVLEGDAPDAPPRSFVWDTYEEYIAPGGPIYFATRKRRVGAPFAIYTDAIEMPTLVPDDMFTAPESRLME